MNVDAACGGAFTNDLHLADELILHRVSTEWSLEAERKSASDADPNDDQPCQSA